MAPWQRQHHHEVHRQYSMQMAAAQAAQTAQAAAHQAAQAHMMQNLMMQNMLHPLMMPMLGMGGVGGMGMQGGMGNFEYSQTAHGYHDQQDAILVMVSDARGRQWWRNFQSSRSATLRIRGRAIEMVGDVLDPGSAEFDERVGRFFSRAAFIPKIFGVDFDRSRGLTPGQVENLAATAAAVRFQPSR